MKQQCKTKANNVVLVDKCRHKKESLSLINLLQTCRYSSLVRLPFVGLLDAPQSSKQSQYFKTAISTSIFFKPSTLAISLLACLFAPDYLINQALAVETPLETVNSVDSTNINASLSDSNEYIEGDERNSNADYSDQQLDQALIALKLKKAVEQGDIDASVLQDYKRETLNMDDNPEDIDANTSNSGESKTNNGLDGLDVDKNEDITDIALLPSLDDDNLNDDSSDSLNFEKDSHLEKNSNLNSDSKVNNELNNPDISSDWNRQNEDFEQQFNRIQDTDNSLNNGLNAKTSQLLDQYEGTDTKVSPDEIERTLAQVEKELELGADTQFDQPIATLDSQDTPIGFDTNLDEVRITAPPKPDHAALDTDISSTPTLVDKETTASIMASVNPSQKQVLNDSPYAEPDNTSTLTNSTNAANNVINTVIEDSNIATNKPTNIASEIPTETVSRTPNVGKASSGDVPANKDITNVVNNIDLDEYGDVVNAASNSGITMLDNYQAINPDIYLPDYEDGAVAQDPITQPNVDSKKADDNSPGFFKGLFNRLFRNGYNSLPKINANIYLQDESRVNAQGQPLLLEADEDVQPISNIKAAMENITVQAVSDFSAVLPKLREESINAAQAVGYYDIDMTFVREDNDKINVIITRLGDPVSVQNRIVEVRGDGQDIEVFKQLEVEAPPQQGEVLNQGIYKQTKAVLEDNALKYGLFDANWLDSSVEIILPDNTADISLIYDTETRYDFGDVVFFTLDENNRITNDPDKLPVKPKLLHQLYKFEVGDPYYQPLITDFTNDLAATSYFNTVNVDTVLPSTRNSDGSLSYESDSNNTEENSSNNKDSNDIIASNNGLTSTDFLDEQNEQISDIDSDASPSAPSQTAANPEGALSGQQNSLNNEATIQTIDDESLQPVQYSVDAETTERMDAIVAKAERLIRLPDDRVLDAEKEKSRNFLGKISDSISNLAEKILPDGDDELAQTRNPPDNLSKTALEHRQTPQQVADAKAVPTYVFVDSDKPRDAEFGIGYGTDTGVRAIARLQNNLINRDGYQAGITVAASGMNQRISLNGSRPWKHPIDDILTGNISYENEDLDKGAGNIDLSTHTIQGRVAREIKNESGWDRTYSLRYRRDELESGITGPARENLPVPFNRNDSRFKQEALLLGYTLERTEADNKIVPSRGWRQYYSLEAGVEDVLTDTNMAIIRAGADGVYSFGESNKHQLVGSLDTGYIVAENFEEVPYQLRFFAGGDRSIRGYGYKSLSAKENGYLVGGQVLAVGSAEYNYEFRDGLRGAVFTDIGNAYDKNFDADTKVGMGVGVRWASPVGIVRVDVGAGVTETSIPVSLHIFIGSPLY